jgi:flavoprotein
MCRWADVLVIAPLSANSLAKISTGLCDNLVTCVARAWDYQAAPLVVGRLMRVMKHSPGKTVVRETAKKQRAREVAALPALEKQ